MYGKSYNDIYILYLIYVGLITHVNNDLYLEYKQIFSAETMHFSIYVSAESVQFAYVNDEEV